MLAAVCEDRDPHPATQQKHSVENVIDEFISRHLTAHRRSASYIKETRRIFDTIALPRWRGRALEQITRRDVMELLDEVVDGRACANSRNRAAKGAPVMANRALATLRAFFHWAVGHGLIETSPVSNIPRPAGENPRDRVLSDEEIVYFWKGRETLGWPFGPMFKLLLLTAQRRDEVGGARWPEIDLDKRLWTIPRERAKNDRAHEVHLSELAVEILSELPKISRSRADGVGSELSPYLFTTSGERPVSGFSKAKERLDGHMLQLLRTELKQAGGDLDAAAIDPWILHDLRRTAATGMARLNITPHVVDRILNHVSGTIRGVAAVYNRHAYLEERKSALEAWSGYVEGLVRLRGEISSQRGDPRSPPNPLNNADGSVTREAG